MAHVWKWVRLPALQRRERGHPTPKRVDQNHKSIVERLRAHPGVSVFSTAPLGKGIPDCCLGYRGINVLIEIKTPKGKLNSTQNMWHVAWTGAPVVILRSLEEADQLIKNINGIAKHWGQPRGTNARP